MKCMYQGTLYVSVESVCVSGVCICQCSLYVTVECVHVVFVSQCGSWCLCLSGVSVYVCVSAEVIAHRSSGVVYKVVGNLPSPPPTRDTYVSLLIL